MARLSSEKHLRGAKAADCPGSGRGGGHLDRTAPPHISVKLATRRRPAAVSRRPSEVDLLKEPLGRRGAAPRCRQHLLKRVQLNVSRLPPQPSRVVA